MTKPEYSVGIDLHKAVIQVCVLDATGSILEERRYRGSTLEEGLAVVTELCRWKERGRFCVEAVGMNRWLVQACRGAGLDLVVADPTKLNLRMLGKKTDRRDAYEIARRLWLGDVDRNAATYYPTEDEYAGRKVLRTRHHLVALRQQLVNQIRALLVAYRVPAPSGVLYGKRAMESLRTLALHHADLQLCLVELVAALQAITDSIEHLAQRITGLAAGERDAHVLSQLPNVGPQTAATLVFELGDLRRFRNSKAVASYAGLVPRLANSADKSSHGTITKRGSPELRFVLSQWAVRLLAFNDRVKAWAAPKLRRMPMNKLRLALARRLLIGVYCMLTRGEVFSLERCLSLA